MLPRVSLHLGPRLSLILLMSCLNEQEAQYEKSPASAARGGVHQERRLRRLKMPHASLMTHWLASSQRPVEIPLSATEVCMIQNSNSERRLGALIRYEDNKTTNDVIGG